MTDQLLIILFTLAWNEYDFIMTQRRFSIMNLFLKPDSTAWKWYFSNNWKTRSWWIKNVFVPLLDGAHLNSSIWRTIAYYWVAGHLCRGWRVYALTLALYAITGGLHSLWNGTLIKFKLKNVKGE